MNISYVDVRRDFARRTDRDATNSSRKYPYIATYPISLFFLTLRSFFFKVSFFYRALDVSLSVFSRCA